MLKPYQQIPIAECHEPLVAITDELFKIQPHAYVSLGAPYGDRDPFWVRQGVLERLKRSQDYLSEIQPDYRIAIFDAYRPIAVQQFMVNHSLAELAASRGLAMDSSTNDQKTALMAEVSKFWAIPSNNPQTPTPHSTGAAIDVTLYQVSSKEPVDMGSPIDEISDRSLPDYFANSNCESEQKYHRDRQLLNQVMTHSGFQSHPHEWWHFSYGDQMWAWLSEHPPALYGGIL
jgi:D-alanyl-D-alanine dipeptidase